MSSRVDKSSSSNITCLPPRVELRLDRLRDMEDSYFRNLPTHNALLHISFHSARVEIRADKLTEMEDPYFRDLPIHNASLSPVYLCRPVNLSTGDDRANCRQRQSIFT